MIKACLKNVAHAQVVFKAVYIAEEVGVDLETVRHFVPVFVLNSRVRVVKKLLDKAQIDVLVRFVKVTENRLIIQDKLCNAVATKDFLRLKTVQSFIPNLVVQIMPICQARCFDCVEKHAAGVF